MARTIKLERKNSVTDLKALKALFGSHEYLNASSADQAAVIEDLTPQVKGDKKLETAVKEAGLRVPSQADTSEMSEEHDSEGLDALGKNYIANAVSSLTRMPSPNLKNIDFRSTLIHWRALIIMALKDRNEPQALVAATLAVVQSEGTFDALRMLRNVAGQMLWAASLDVQRARRTQSEHEEEHQSTFSDGDPDHMDSDRVTPPTEDEAIDALIAAHGWLSNVADLLPNDADDRFRLGLDDGLEYCSIKEGEDWVRVFDVNDAIDIQLDKNKAQMQAKDAKKVLSRKAAFEALAALAA